MAQVRFGDWDRLDRSLRIRLDVKQGVNNPITLDGPVGNGIEHNEQIDVRFLVGLATNP